MKGRLVHDQRERAIGAAGCREDVRSTNEPDNRASDRPTGLVNNQADEPRLFRPTLGPGRLHSRGFFRLITDGGFAQPDSRDGQSRAEKARL